MVPGASAYAKPEEPAEPEEEEDGCGHAGGEEGEEDDEETFELEALGDGDENLDHVLSDALDTNSDSFDDDDVYLPSYLDRMCGALVTHGAGVQACAESVPGIDMAEMDSRRPGTGGASPAGAASAAASPACHCTRQRVRAARTKLRSWCRLANWRSARLI